MVRYLKLCWALVRLSAGMRLVDGTAVRPFAILYMNTKRWHSRRCSSEGQPRVSITDLCLIPSRPVDMWENDSSNKPSCFQPIMEEVIGGSIRTGSDDLEWPLSRVSRSLYSYKSNISKAVRLRDKVTI